MVTAKQAIETERQRQIDEGCWSADHDNWHGWRTLELAGRCYMGAWGPDDPLPSAWPFSPEWWEPGTRRRNLEKAGALCMAARDVASRQCDRLACDEIQRSILEAERRLGMVLSPHFCISDHHVKAIREMQEEVHSSCVEKGWYSDLDTGGPIERNVFEMISLMHSELSEAVEALRKGVKDRHLRARPGAEVEFADCIIRILDAAGYLGFDLAGAIQDKFAYNQTRKDHSLEERRKPGGRKI